MKKFLLLATMVASAATMSAQYAHVDYNVGGVNADDKTSLTAGQTFASIEGVGTVSNAFDEQFKTVNIKTDGYAFFYAGETALNTDTLGIQGQNNGKDSDGGNPAFTLSPYASGAAIQYKADKDGFLTVFHKASSNKQYIVFENGTAIGYEFAQLAKIGDAPEVISYVIQGEGEYNAVKDTIFQVQQIVVKEGFSSKNGESAMRFPVYAGCTYLFGATGSKMSILGVYFSEARQEISVAKADGADKLVLLTTEVNSIANVAASSKNVVVYNLLGQRVAANTKGLVIINGKKVIRK